MKGLKSLSLKNFLTTALILLVSFLLTGLAFSGTFYRYSYLQNRRNMAAALGQAARVVNAYAAQRSLDDLELRIALSTSASLSGTDLILADAQGVVISCSDRELNCVHIGRRVPADVLETAGNAGAAGSVGERRGPAAGGVEVFQEVYGAGRRQYVAVTVSGAGDDRTAGYLIMSAPLRSLWETWREDSGLFLLVAAAVFLIAAIVTSLASRHQIRPINEMAAAADRFARGDLDARVREDGRRDEIGVLQRSFNAMADSLEHTEKDRRELVANVSHDLKTPITAITGFAEGILDGTVPPEKEKEYLGVIASEARRMNRMVQNMLTMSRVQAVDPAEILRGSFDICEVVRLSLIGMESRIEEKKLEVALTLPEEEILTRGDADAITRVLTNLLDNAVKFADPGSTLTLEVWKMNGKAYVSVQDRGVTIPRDELPRIFERFHKSDASRNLDKNGSGLGLFIVKTIIDSHREDVYVSSEDGVTRFVFTLTLSGEPSTKRL